MDLVEQRAELAIHNGAEAASTSAGDFRSLCFQKTGGAGVDAVLITAETPLSGPVNLAAEVARDRATVVAVGTVGMELERKLYYEKELTFRVSRSYGPGRYDTAYEQKGRDYPIGHVRWTETRNMEAFLRFVADRRLDLESVVTHRFPIDEARRAYDLILGRSLEPFLGVLLTYSQNEGGRLLNRAEKTLTNAAVPPPRLVDRSSIGIAVLGAGAFAQNTLLPALKSVPHVSMVGVCNATGPRSRSAAQKLGFAYCSSSEDELLRDESVDAVVIATRHNLHANQALAALGAQKSVFCEKPLALTRADAEKSVAACAKAGVVLGIGHERRYEAGMVEVERLVAEGKLGTIMHAEADFSHDKLANVPAGDWRTQ